MSNISFTMQLMEHAVFGPEFEEWLKNEIAIVSRAQLEANGVDTKDFSDALCVYGADKMIRDFFMGDEHHSDSQI